MPQYVDPRFRPTLWPGSLVEEPYLRPLPEAVIDGEWIVWPAPRQMHREAVRLPGDFYLREMMEIDPEDFEGVLDLVRTYGIFCDDDSDLPVDAPKVPLPKGLTQDGLIRGYHRDSVRVHMEIAQEATRIWLALQREGGIEELVEPQVQGIRDSFAEHDLPSSRADALDFLVETSIFDLTQSMNAALKTFSIGVGGLDDRWVTVYSVAFLQMYNHMAEGASVRQCENEPCRRDFVRQRGRAEYGQYRTEGVKYCSRECARAQAQRELRRRRRAAKRPPGVAK